MKSQLWTVLKNGNKVNTFGVDGIMAWAEGVWGAREGFAFKSFANHLLTALLDPQKKVIQLRDQGNDWVLARITE